MSEQGCTVVTTLAKFTYISSRVDTQPRILKENGQEPILPCKM